MSVKDYEKMSIPELWRLAKERKIPIPRGIREMRGVTSDPYAEQGRRDLIAELKSLDTRLRERAQDKVVITTLQAAIVSAVIGGIALLFSIIKN